MAETNGKKFQLSPSLIAYIALLTGGSGLANSFVSTDDRFKGIDAVQLEAAITKDRERDLRLLKLQIKHNSDLIATLPPQALLEAISELKTLVRTQDKRLQSLELVLARLAKDR